jgi:hypothetical protein
VMMMVVMMMMMMTDAGNYNNGRSTAVPGRPSKFPAVMQIPRPAMNVLGRIKA